MNTARTSRVSIAALALVQALAAAACVAGVGAAPASSPEVTGARIGPAPAGQFETWAYATIDNKGAADSLVDVRSDDAASVVLRATTMTDAGRKARSVVSIPLPAHGVVALSPDTYFLAFIQARHAFVPGQHVSATLRFGSGAERTVEVLVGSPEGDPADTGQ